MQFLEDPAKFLLFAGGVGSGKSFVGSHYSFKKVCDYPRALGLIGANTYRQLQNSTLACLFAEMERLNIPFSYNKNAGVLYIYSTKILCVSLDNYNLHRGIELGWFWIDETRDTKEAAFTMLMGRLRDKRCGQLEGRLTSTTSGYNWLHEYFDGDKKTKEFSLISATSMDNPYLPDGYIETLKQSYDDKVYRQEVLGEFVNTTQGRIYYAFTKKNNVCTVNHDPKLPIWIGCDFNRNPITAIITHVHDNTLHVFDEIHIMSSDTDELANEITTRYGKGHHIVPDSTGKRKQTSSSGKSDHEILRLAGFVIEGSRNPFRIDRYNCVNNLLSKARIKIDKRCKRLIKDLNQVTYKEGSSQIDDTDPDLTHLSDGLGYLSWFCYPIKKPTVAPRSI